MTSLQKINANRANAQGSTGPITAAGKIRAAQNARRHGLSLSVYADPSYPEQIESLAQEIAGEGAKVEIVAIARRIAEAQIDLIRIRRIRHDLRARYSSDADDDVLAQKRLSRSMPQDPHKAAAILSDLAKQLMLIDRYQRRSLSRRKFAIRAFDLARRHAGRIAVSPPAAADKK